MGAGNRPGEHEPAGQRRELRADGGRQERQRQADAHAGESLRLQTPGGVLLVVVAPSVPSRRAHRVQAQRHELVDARAGDHDQLG
jgi:hypothetical protein